MNVFVVNFQVSRTNLEQFYETTCRGEIFMYACKMNVIGRYVFAQTRRQSRGIFEMKPANVQASPCSQTILKKYCT